MKSIIIKSIIINLLVTLIIFYFIFRMYITNNDGLFVRNEYYTTKFADSFTFEKLEELKIGMDSHQVYQIIGKPILEFNKRTNVQDIDSFFIGAAYSIKKNKPFPFNYNWFLVSIYFDRNLKLIGIKRSWIDGG